MNDREPEPTGQYPGRDRLPVETPPPTEAGPDALGATLPAGPMPPTGEVLPEVLGYAVLERIGKGGMGVVYRARDKALDRLVAVKMIRDGVLATPVELARFQAEARSVARLSHPNIVQIFHVGEHHGRPYLVLELVPGGNLAQRLSVVPMPPAEAARLVEVLARTMQYAHEQGIIHRDLKPANILLAADGSPKIADFGLAKEVEGEILLTHTSQGPMGTPSYMAPEQAWGKPSAVGATADVYALGAVLYECLTGQPPFCSGSVMDVLVQVKLQEPIEPRRLRPEVPRDLETIVLKCLRKEPENRYASAAELADDLGRFLRGEPIRARRVGVVERAAKWVRKRAAVATLTGLLLFGAALVGLGAWYVQGLFAEYAAEKAKRDEELKFRTYPDTLARIGAALETGDRPAAEGLLAETPAGLRGWEWGYLSGLLAGKQTPVVSKVPNGPALGVLHDPAAGTFLTRLHDGKPPRAWKPDSGLEVAPPPFELPGRAVALSPDGELAADALSLVSPAVPGIEIGSTLRVFGRDGEVRWAKAQTLTTSDVAFSPDGRLVAVSLGRGFELVAPPTPLLGPPAPAGPAAPPQKGTGRGSARAGFFVATGAGPADNKGPIQAMPDPGVLVVYRADTGEVVRRFDQPARCSCVAFSPDGSLLAVGDAGGAIILREVATWQVKHSLQAGATPLVRLAFAPKGRWLASASEDAVRLWDLGSCDLVATASEDAVAAIAFDATGDRLFTASGRVVRVRDVPKLRHLLALPANDPVPSKFLAVAYDGKAGVLAGLETTGRLQLWGGSAPGVGKIEAGRSSPAQGTKNSQEGVPAPAPLNQPGRQKGEKKDEPR